MRIALLHTAEVHVATFDAIFGNLSSTVTLNHRVATDLLAKARRDGIGAVREETTAVLSELAEADAVLCTCSTLGPIADEVATHLPHVVRIDRPLMETACLQGRHVLVAMCLESTRAPTLDLFAECTLAVAHDVKVTPMICAGAWPHFEAGDTRGFAEAVVATIRTALAEHPTVDCIVLAQASMRVAEPLLADAGVPVLSSPEIAARRCMAIAAQGASTIRSPR